MKLHLFVGPTASGMEQTLAELNEVVVHPPAKRGDIQALVRRCDARAVIVPATYADIDLCEVIESLRPTLLSLRVLIVDGAPRAGWSTLDALFEHAPIDSTSLPGCPVMAARAPPAPIRLAFRCLSTRSTCSVG